MEGLRRLTNVLNATNVTLKNVNNTCTLVINSAKYFALFSGDFTGIRWRVLHMSTTFAVFVSTLVTLFYSCARLRHLCPHQQASHTVWLFEGNHGRRRKDVVLFGFFFRRMHNAHEWCWSCFLESDGMWGHNGFFYISVFLCTEINCPWNCYEFCLNFSS